MLLGERHRGSGGKTVPGRTAQPCAVQPAASQQIKVVHLCLWDTAHTQRKSSAERLGELSALLGWHHSGRPCSTSPTHRSNCVDLTVTSSQPFFPHPTHVAHAEVTLELAEEVVDENSAILLDAQQVLAGCPAQLHQLAALPLQAGN